MGLIMKKEIQRAAERGITKLNWLDSRHSFSFGSYHNPKRNGFGKLLVLNDDIVGPGKGFGTHHHDNMEIISIVLEGALEHKDGMGNHGIIRKGEIQRISAGSGITHSEFNHSDKERANFLQIWIEPREQDIKPGYEQRKFSIKNNGLMEAVSPAKGKDALSINQDARISIAKLGKGNGITYKIAKKGNGAYLLVIYGRITVDEEKLNARDAIGISGAGEFRIEPEISSEILIIDVPLN